MGLEEAVRMMRDHVVVVLDSVNVNVKCGLHPWERHPERPNRLKISIKLFVPIASGSIARLGPIVDYDHIRDFLVSLERLPHIDLLEELADLILDVCFHDVRVESCSLSIRKPDIFNEADGAGINIYRSRKNLR